MKIRKALVKEAEIIVNYSFDNFYEYLIKEWNRKNKFISEIIEYKDREKAKKDMITEVRNDIKQNVFFVAEEKKEIIGHICGSINKRKNRVINKEGVLKRLHVKEDWRRNGIGLKLFNRLKEEFKKKGVDFIRVGTASINKKAIGLYKKAGFIETGKKMIEKL